MSSAPQRRVRLRPAVESCTKIPVPRPRRARANATGCSFWSLSWSCSPMPPCCRRSFSSRTRRLRRAASRQVSRSRLSRRGIEQQVRSRTNDGFGIASAHSARCLMGSAWAKGQQFACFVYDSRNLSRRGLRHGRREPGQEVLLVQPVDAELEEWLDDNKSDDVSFVTFSSRSAKRARRIRHPDQGL